MYERVYVIGLGGIGSALVKNVARICAYQDDAPKELVLVDGDKYDLGNRVRQSMKEADEGRTKVAVHAEELRRTFPTLRVQEVPKFLARTPKADDAIRATDVIKDNSIVITGLDNDPARLMIEDIASDMKNMLVLNGGNLLVQGHVYAFMVMDGFKSTRPIRDVYPDKAVYESHNRNPGDLDCEERQALKGGQQLLATNNMVAAFLVDYLADIVGLIPQGKEVVEAHVRKCTEIIFDLRKKSMATYGHGARKPRNLVRKED